MDLDTIAYYSIPVPDSVVATHNTTLYSQRPVYAWFLKLLSSVMSVYMHIHVCVSVAPGAINNLWHDINHI